MEDDPSDNPHCSAPEFSSADCVKLIIQQLKFTNVPKGLAAAYQSATENGGVEGTFLDAGGFSAWFAYFLTRRAAKSATHFDGQAACNQMLDALAKVSTIEQTSLAKRLRESIPEDLALRIQQVYDKAIGPGQTERAVLAAKRRRTTDNSDLAYNVEASTNSVSLSVDACPSNSRFDLGNPAVLRATALLEPFIAGAVKKYRIQNNGDARAAAITMSFPDVATFGNKLGSMMSLEVTSNKVERLANWLFGAEVELMDEHRYLILPTGLRIIPSTDLVLRGCKRDVILEVFGADLHNAITTSPAYREEAELGNPLTECVTMTISHRASDGAIINLSLDEKEAFRVKGKLYD